MLIQDAFTQSVVAHHFLMMGSGEDTRFAWSMFREAGEKIAKHQRDMEAEQAEWDCGHDTWQQDEDL